MNLNALLIAALICFVGSTYANLHIHQDASHIASQDDIAHAEGQQRDQAHRIVTRNGFPPCNGDVNLCSLKFNQVTFAGSHNAGSGFCGPLRSLGGGLNIPCFSRNQDLSFAEQLDFGIRFFDVDLCYIEPGTAGFSPAGPWTCHGAEYGGAIEKALMQIDQWMQLNPNEVISINFNHDFDHSLSDVIAPDLHALVEGLWNPTPERISDGNLTMNTYYNETLEWPTLLQAIETNQRIFVFLFESLWLGGKPWIHVRPTGTVGPVVDDDCSLLVANSRRDCNLCVDLVQMDFYGAYGHCIFDMARICSIEMYNGSQACYDERIQFGKTVNFLLVDFPNRATSPFTVVEVANSMNALNIQHYTAVDPITTNQTLPSTCLPEPIPPTEPSSLPPITSTCEALQRIASNPVGYFQCEANTDEGCDRLVCPADLLDTNGAALFQLQVIVRSCDDPTAIQFILTDPASNELVNITADQSGSIDFLGIPIIVVFDQLEDAVGLQLRTTGGPRPGDDGITLVEYAVIPIDTTTCAGSGSMLRSLSVTGLATVLLFCLVILF